jgi:D-alanyl-D-alanine carboxypeptidase
MKLNGQKKSHFAQMALALAFLVGSFSIFSVAFGVQKSHVFNITDTIYTSKKPQKKYTFIDQRRNNLFLNEQVEDKIEARYILQHLEKLGAIRARSFLVGDLDTGEVIFERKPHTQFPIASLTKYITAFTAAKTLEPNEIAIITKEKLKVEGNRAHFRVGDKLTIRTLLYPLLLVSSNDAGEIIAQQRNRDSFIKSMNSLMQLYKLYNTSFEDPTGLSKNNTSTARDLFKIMRIVKNEFPQIVDISELNMIQTKGYTWRNINKASRIPEFEGGKTGYTNAARQTSIGYYQIKLANDQIKNIGIVILQSGTRQQDTKNILDYLKRYVAYL